MPLFKYGSTPLSKVLLSTVPVKNGPLGSESSKREIPEINKPKFQIVGYPEHSAEISGHPLFPHPGQEPSLCPAFLGVHAPRRQTLSCVHDNGGDITVLIDLVMAPKTKSSDAGDADVPKGSHQVLPLREKVCLYRKTDSVYRGSVQSTLSGIY